MSAATLVALLRRRYAPPATDAELLRAYADSGDGDAFRDLVGRHGPLVLRLCRRLLGDAHAAEDAFQATFLVLARRAGSVRQPASLAAWLYGTARRVCGRARVARDRRRAAEARAVPRAVVDPAAELSARELLEVLDAELDRLPERYRLPLALIYWQGLAHAEAARRLGLSPGALQGRLNRGRARLAARLTRRGLAPATLLAAPAATVAVPADLLARTVALAAAPWSKALPAAVVTLTAATVPLKTFSAAGLGVTLAAACLLGLAANGARQTEPQKAAPPAQAPDRFPSAKFSGTVSGPDGRRVAGATVIAVGDVGIGERLAATTDAEGRFGLPGLPAGKTAFPSVYLFAVKEGFGPVIKFVDIPPTPDAADLALPVAAAFGGVVKDDAGRPVAGAEVQVGYVRRTAPLRSGGGGGASFGYVPPSAVRGTPAEPFFFTKTDEAGGFRFPTLPVGSELIFRVSAEGFAELHSGAGMPKEGQHVVKADAPPAELVLRPEAILAGRVESNVPGVLPDAAELKLEGTETLHGFRRTVKLAADGRFTVARLPAGPISVSVGLPPGAQAMAVGKLVTTTAGRTNDVELKIVSGIEVTGRVVLRDTNEPVPGVFMATLGPVNPEGFHFGGRPTDTNGRFAMRLPPGLVMVLVWRAPGDYRRIAVGYREVVVPADVAKFEIPEPFELGKVGGLATVPGAPVVPGAGPALVDAERPAAALVRQHGGWYTLDGLGRVVGVNMMSHVDPGVDPGVPGGLPTDNALIDSDGALRAAGQFPRLKKLTLYRGQATDEALAALAGLTNLEELSVWDATAVGDAGVAHLAGLSKLRRVQITNSQIGDGALAVFGRLPSLQKLTLDGNHFSDVGLKHLAGLKQLQSLSVGWNKEPITDAGAQHLAGLTRLEELDIRSSRLTVAGVAALKDLTQLQTLYFDGHATEGVDDADLGPLLGMKRLKMLILGNTRLTGVGVRQLLALPDLHYLDLTSPLIGPAAQEDLKKGRPGVQLRISGPSDGR